MGWCEKFDVADVDFDYETFNPVRACMDGIHLDGGCRFAVAWAVAEWLSCYGESRNAILWH